jgi:hypothetical protein
LRKMTRAAAFFGGHRDSVTLKPLGRLARTRLD